jgi:predicted lipoprotein
MLFYGPIKDQVFWQANFYPKVYPNLVEYLVSSGRSIDGGLIDRIGAPLKGFEAAEYLLFAPLATQMSRAGLDTNTMTNPSVSWLLQGKFAQRRRQYLDAITRILSAQLQAAANEARDKNFPDKFAAAGQKSVNLLVNQLTVTLEMDLILPLQDSLSAIPAVRAHNNLRIGAFSGEFLPGMKAALEGLHRFYRGEGGSGLDDYAQTVNPNLNDRLEKQFEATALALDSLKTPLDTSGATEHPEFQNALDEAHKLEVLLKVDLTSALGVTIMFNAYDGD